MTRSKSLAMSAHGSPFSGTSSAFAQSVSAADSLESEPKSARTANQLGNVARLDFRDDVVRLEVLEVVADAAEDEDLSA